MVGKTIAHYQITEKLGEGGMGVVYKARDTHLDRFVAIKVLPPERVADADRQRRFVQEAKAASALNHPNIITVYDISQAEGVTFMAVEYIEGRTLDQVVGRKGLSLNDTLKLAIQITGALAKAHGAGIVHRDLKPSNIMVTGDGLVKVLDFGLAKLTEKEAPASAGEVSSRETATVAAKTAEGTVVGTAAYMSPEQAQGLAVDARSDVFSFGAVLYEMVSGRRAFTGDTAASTLAAILRDEPKPVSQVSADTPRDLEKIIARCLRKDPARRFQHMDDVKVAIEELKEESDSGALVAGAPPPKRRRRGLVWAACALVVALAAGAAAWYLRRPAPGPPPRVSAFAARAGIEWGPALSPDGKQIAFVWNGEKEDSTDIYVQLVDETTPRRLTTDPAFDYSPVWSPDGLRIAFLRNTPAGTEILMIPAGGGAEKRLHVSAARWQTAFPSMARQFCGLGWSPDGRFLTIVDRETPQSPNSIFLLDIETREKRKLTTPPSGWFGDGVSVFSPDGRMLAFARTRVTLPSDLYVLRLSDRYEPRGEPRRLTGDGTLITGLDWTADGRSVIFASMRAGVSALWRVGASGGEPERLTVGSENAQWPSVSRRGDRLAYAQAVWDTNIWRVAAPGGGATGAPVRLTQSSLWDTTPAFSPDGRKITWASNQSGSYEVWTATSDGSQPARLTSLRHDVLFPKWSPDGRHIVFSTGTGGPAHVYVIGSEGGAPRRLTTGEYEESGASWSRDGKWVYFMSDRGEGWAVWKVPSAGGAPVLVVRKGFRPVFESFDGKWVYYTGPDGFIWKLPAGGGEPALALKKGRRAFWTISATGIYVLDPDAAGGPAAEFFPFAPGGRKDTLKLTGDANAYLAGLGALAVSPDGRWMLYTRVDRNESDVMLVEQFR